MKFTHLIEINDRTNPLLTPLSRQQLWRGLVLRAKAPALFMPHLDECTIAESDDELLRELRYGSVVIRDRVTLVEAEQVQYRVPAQADIAASRLEMTIEEPQPYLLYVRFTYHDEGEDEGGNENGGGAEVAAMVEEFRRAAYEEADIDTIAIIRQLAAEGRLGSD